tara:strand:- start:7808 stop:9211 length:1404 start_codon:yes stop_codon:yes gene_type:complete
MINKNYNLLGEQLAESGLEMSLEPIITASLISAGTSLVSGIMGGSSAAKANKKERENAKKERQAAKQVQRNTNRYSRDADKADKANYEAEREFSHQNNLKTWERGKELQDYEYLKQLKLYEKSQQISNQQQDLNALAGTQAIDAELDAIDDMFLQQQFQNETSLSSLKKTYFEASASAKEQGLKSLQISTNKDLGLASLQNTIQQARGKTAMDKESALIDGLIAQGKASLGQAGVSSAKRQQSNTAALQRGLMSLERQMTGEVTQAQIKMLELSADASLQQLGVGLNLERVSNTITEAEAEADYNKKISKANMDSFLAQSSRNIKDIELQKQFADLNTQASQILFPERLGYNPKPELPPERIFVPRMEVEAGYVATPAQQSTSAPVLSGLIGAGSALVGQNFSGLFGGGGGNGFNPGAQSSNLFNNNIANFGGGTQYSGLQNSGSMPGGFPGISNASQFGLAGNFFQ